MNKKKYRTRRHSVSLLHAHLIFTPKFRKHIFQSIHLMEMKYIFIKICNNFDTELKEFNGEKDHVHLLINFPPHLQLSKLVNSLKGVSSRKLREKFEEIRKFCWKNCLWTRSYFASSCGGASIEVLKKYIENQKIPINTLAPYIPAMNGEGLRRRC